MPENWQIGVRITPAGAGKTRWNSSKTPIREDHPRRCGENSYDVIANSASAGSPPQVRGKQLKRLTIKRRDRITPAGAGKTPPEARDCAMLRDHPRRCGENSSASSSLIPHQGSPPQVRGKPANSRFKDKRSRITPAGAGKTQSRKLRNRIMQDHPRRCGENIN